jgi:hypothetical protein
MRVLCSGGAPCQEGFVCRLEEEGGLCVEEGAEETEESEEAKEAKEPEESEETEAAEEGEVAEEAAEKEEPEEVAEEGTTSSLASTQSSSTSSADPQVAAMAEEDLAPARWTQQYCSAHIGFCIAIHKNWYYKSFGATSSVLWHVEVGTRAVEDLGDGPLIVNLATGDLSSLGVTDGTVRERGGKVIGYRTWSDNRHFEISADASLRDAVSYITRNLKVSD